MLAPTYQTYKIVGEIYIKNGKEYIDIQHPRTGNIRAARWYSEKEFIKIYGKEHAAAGPTPPISVNFWVPPEVKSFSYDEENNKKVLRISAHTNHSLQCAYAWITYGAFKKKEKEEKYVEN